MAERWVALPEGAPTNTQASYAQILAVHAALLHNGKVLYFGGSQHLIDPNDPRAARLQSVGDPRLDNTRIWDPATGQVNRLSSPQPPQPPIDNLYDLFCCGHAFLPDGRLLVGGGTSGYPPAESDHHHEHYRGSRRSSIFDPGSATGSPWSRAGEMVQPPSSVVDPNAGPNGDGSVGGGGRWYPTLMTLSDRSIIALGGHPQEVDPRHSNYSIEAFAADAAHGGSWSLVGEEPPDVQSANDALQRPEVFPRVHLLPNGRVFFVCLIDGNSYSWDPAGRHATLAGGWDRLAPFRAGPTQPDPDQAAWATTYFDTGRPRYSRSFFAWSSVLLPLLPEEGYKARVLIVGRQQPFVIDLGGPSDVWPPAAQWHPTAPRDQADARLFQPSAHRPVASPETEFPGRGDQPAGSPGFVRYSNVPGMRQQCFAILLPDATVVVIGGSTTHPEDWSGYFFDGVQLPEVFNPATGQWRTISAPATVPRVYHGVALLLPDGRIWTAGSNPWGDGKFGLFTDGGHTGDWEERIEVFEPWYFAMPRPVITQSPPTVRHGFAFEVQTPQASAITRVALIRAASATHGQIFDQRYVSLRFDATGPDRLRVSAPPQAAIAPPGYYLLFVADGAGVPSIGSFVRVSLGWEPWFPLGPNTFPPGASVIALSLAPGATSLYVIGLDNEGLGGGKVFTKFFPDPVHPPARGGWSDWLALEDRNAAVRRVFPVGAPVTAISTAPGATSLYVIGLDNEGLGGGKVFTKFFPDPARPTPQGQPGRWSDWLPIEERDPAVRRVFPAGAPITALSTAPGATSLYVVGLDGQIWSNFFPQQGRAEWSGWFALGPKTFPLRARIAAETTNPGETSLFAIGADGLPWSTFFDPQG